MVFERNDEGIEGGHREVGDFYTILSIQLNGLLAKFQIKKEDDEGPSPSHQQAIGTRHVGGSVMNVLGIIGGTTQAK